VDEIRMEQGNASVPQSKCDGVSLDIGMRYSQTWIKAVNKRSLSAFFSSAGVRVMTVDAVPIVPLIV